MKFSKTIRSELLKIVSIIVVSKMCAASNAADHRSPCDEWLEYESISNTKAFDDYAAACHNYSRHNDRTVELYNQVLSELASSTDSNLDGIGTSYALSFEHALNFLEKVSFPKMGRGNIEFEELEKLRYYILRFNRIFEGGEKERDWQHLKEALPVQYLFTKDCLYLGEELSFEGIIKGNWEALKLFDKMKNDIRSWTQNRFCILFDQVPPEYTLQLRLAEYDCLSLDLPLISICQFASSVVFSKNFIQLVKKYEWINDMFCCLTKQLLELRILYKQKIMIKKTYKKMFDRYKLLKMKVDYQKEEELKKASRKPTKSERKYLNKLMRMGKKQRVDQIRVIDTKSLIKSYNLCSSDKNYLINLLDYGDLQNLYTEIDHFLSSSCFFDEPSFNESIIALECSSPSVLKLLEKTLFPKKMSLKNLIKHHMKAAANHSEERRSQIIALIAWARALSPSICDLERWPEEAQTSLYESRIVRFCCSTDTPTSAGYDTITLNFVQLISATTEGMDENFSIFPILYRESLEKVLFHEICHIFAGSLAFNNCTQISLLSKGFVIQRNLKAIKRNLGKIKSLAVDTFFQAIDQERHRFPINATRKEDTMTFFETMQYDDEIYTQFNIFNEKIEGMQILGLLENNGIAYFCSFSDFSTSAKEGSLFRVSHTLLNSSSTNDKDEWANVKFPSYLKLKKGITQILLNPVFFKLLLQCNGVKIAKYRELSALRNLAQKKWIIRPISLDFFLKYENKLGGKFPCSQKNIAGHKKCNFYLKNKKMPKDWAVAVAAPVML